MADAGASKAREPNAGAPSVEQLSTQLMQLAALTQRNSKLLVRQGEDIIRIDTESRLARVQPPGTTAAVPQPASPGVDDGVIEELVAQLTFKLDELEERSIRRVSNSTLTAGDGVIDWLPSADPDNPEFALPAQTDDGVALALPKTVAQLEKSDTRTLLEIMKAYALAHYEPGMPLPTDAEAGVLYDELARFLGLRSRAASRKSS